MEEQTSSIVNIVSFNPSNGVNKHQESIDFVKIIGGATLITFVTGLLLSPLVSFKVLDGRNFTILLSCHWASFALLLSQTKSKKTSSPGQMGEKRTFIPSKPSEQLLKPAETLEKSARQERTSQPHQLPDWLSTPNEIKNIIPKPGCSLISLNPEGTEVEVRVDLNSLSSESEWNNIGPYSLKKYQQLHERGETKKIEKFEEFDVISGIEVDDKRMMFLIDGKLISNPKHINKLNLYPDWAEDKILGTPSNKKTNHISHPLQLEKFSDVEKEKIIKESQNPSENPINNIIEETKQLAFGVCEKRGILEQEQKILFGNVVISNFHQGLLSTSFNVVLKVMSSKHPDLCINLSRQDLKTSTLSLEEDEDKLIFESSQRLVLMKNTELNRLLSDKETRATVSSDDYCLVDTSFKCEMWPEVKENGSFDIRQIVTFKYKILPPDQNTI